MPRSSVEERGLRTSGRLLLDERELLHGGPGARRQTREIEPGAHGLATIVATIPDHAPISRLSRAIDQRPHDAAADVEDPQRHGRRAGALWNGVIDASRRVEWIRYGAEGPLRRQRRDRAAAVRDFDGRDFTGRIVAGEASERDPRMR